jgi:hypothetical protein
MYVRIYGCDEPAMGRYLMAGLPNLLVFGFLLVFLLFDEAPEYKKFLFSFFWSF